MTNLTRDLIRLPVDRFNLLDRSQITWLFLQQRSIFHQIGVFLGIYTNARLGCYQRERQQDIGTGQLSTRNVIATVWGSCHEVVKESQIVVDVWMYESVFKVGGNPGRDRADEEWHRGFANV